MDPGALLIVDAHEDLAMNALPEGRDYLRSAYEIRALEAEAGFDSPNGICMLGLPEWLRGRVAVVVATVTVIPRAHAHPGEMSYLTVDGAHIQGLAQIDLYRRWTRRTDQVALIQERSQLEDVLGGWSDSDRGSSGRRVGLVLSMENADPIRGPSEVGFWVEEGIRIIGPAWHSNRYAGDTRAGGPLTPRGRELLVEMDRLGVALDLSHMSDEAALEATEGFQGMIVATHANSRRTVGKPRMLPDSLIERIAGRGGVVGILPQNWAVAPQWKTGNPKDAVTLSHVVDAIDTVCDIVGDAEHVGIGSDFDGGAGAEEAPAEIDTVADLSKLAPALAARGYSEEAITGVMSGNWLRVLRSILP